MDIICYILNADDLDKDWIVENTFVNEFDYDQINEKYQKNLHEYLFSIEDNWFAKIAQKKELFEMFYNDNLFFEDRYKQDYQNKLFENNGELIVTIFKHSLKLESLYKFMASQAGQNVKELFANNSKVTELLDVDSFLDMFFKFETKKPTLEERIVGYTSILDFIQSKQNPDKENNQIEPDFTAPSSNSETIKRFWHWMLKSRCNRLKTLTRI